MSRCCWLRVISSGFFSSIRPEGDDKQISECIEEGNDIKRGGYKEGMM